MYPAIQNELIFYETIYECFSVDELKYVPLYQVDEWNLVQVYKTWCMHNIYFCIVDICVSNH